MTSARSARTVLLALGVLAALSSCTVTFGKHPDASTGPTVPPLVRHNAAELDLRTKPTRESLGFQPGDSGAGYDRKLHSAGIKVHVDLPNGRSTDLLAFGLASEALPRYSDGVAGPDTVPTATIVNVRYTSAEQAQEALLRQVDALELDPERLGVSAGGARPGVLAASVIQGYNRDWLDVEVEIRTDQDANEVIANYEFNYNAEELRRLPTFTPTVRSTAPTPRPVTTPAR